MKNSSTINSNQNSEIKNEFNPNSKNISPSILNDLKPKTENILPSVDSLNNTPKKNSLQNIPSTNKPQYGMKLVDPAKFKTIFTGKISSTLLLEENRQEITITWNNPFKNKPIIVPEENTPKKSTPTPSPSPTPAPLPQTPSKDPNENLSPETTSNTSTEPSKPKEPMTLESIFQKYIKLNKIVTKIIHKKKNGRTEKWVHFQDGTSVLEDPGEDPVMPQKKILEFKLYKNNFLTAKDLLVNEEQSNLVAEFDPNNPNNIALTLYEITTLKRKHLFCRYYDSAFNSKYESFRGIVDFEQFANPSIYHNLDLLDDSELLKPPEAKSEEPTHFWTKTLRKSNRSLMPKRNRNKSKN
jgi:hypothetical protein